MDQSRPGTIAVSKRTLLCAVLGALLVGSVLGRIEIGGGARAATPVADATATRNAELDELHRLQTQVAQTVVCTLPPTPTPTPTPLPTATPTPVPPVAMGTPVTAADNWTVVVTGMTPAPAFDAIQPVGKFVMVSIALTNNGTDSRRFDFSPWILVDGQGRVFELSIDASNEASGGDLVTTVSPSLPKELKIVFDVAVDAGPAFTLESRVDPMWRVALQVQVLG